MNSTYNFNKLEYEGDLAIKIKIYLTHFKLKNMELKTGFRKK